MIDGIEDCDKFILMIFVFDVMGVIEEIIVLSLLIKFEEIFNFILGKVNLYRIEEEIIVIKENQ